MMNNLGFFMTGQRKSKSRDSQLNEIDLEMTTKMAYVCVCVWIDLYHIIMYVWTGIGIHITLKCNPKFLETLEICT